MGEMYLFPRYRRSVKALAALLLGIAAPPMAMGTPSFNPIVCSQCPTMTEVDWTFHSDEMPFDPNCAVGTCPHYTNNIYYWRSVIANRNVKQFEFRVDYFETEFGYDWLDYWEYQGSATRLWGSVAPGWKNITSSSVLQHKPVEFRFRTDSSVSRPGFRIGRARVCCQNTGGYIETDAPMRQSFRQTGVLLGTNDVVWMHVPVGPSGQTRNLVLWGTGQDFDIYVRCNALPSATAFDFVGNSGNSQEFRTWVEPGGCTYPGTWYIAVHSYAGSGQFSVVPSTMFNTKSVSNIRAGVDFLATQAQLNTFANTLSQGGRQFYGQTEGQFLLRNFNLYNNTGANCTNCGGAICTVCFKNAAGTAEVKANGQIDMFQSYWGDPEGFAHELGHWGLFVPDEYAGPQWLCGHSNMAFPWGSQNNHCFFYDSGRNDHGKDGTPWAPAPGSNSAWSILNTHATIVPVIMYETPDNYDYRDHDMGGDIIVYQQ
jgi:hypothetical protein